MDCCEREQEENELTIQNLQHQIIQLEEMDQHTSEFQNQLNEIQVMLGHMQQQQQQENWTKFNQLKQRFLSIREQYWIEQDIFLLEENCEILQKAKQTHEQNVQEIAKVIIDIERIIQKRNVYTVKNLQYKKLVSEALSLIDEEQKVIDSMIMEQAKVKSKSDSYIDPLILRYSESSEMIMMQTPQKKCSYDETPLGQLSNRNTLNKKLIRNIEYEEMQKQNQNHRNSLKQFFRNIYKKLIFACSESQLEQSDVKSYK